MEIGRKFITLLSGPSAREPADSATAAKPQVRLSGLVLLLGFMTAFGSISIDMYLPSFPDISRDFSVPLSRVQLSLTSFFLGISFGQLLYGPLSDRFGRRPPLIIGIFLYIAASMVCSYCTNVNALIFSRFVQALGACAGIVIARAVVRDLFDPQESGRVYSLLMLVMGVSPILAPLLGGYIATGLGWRAIFYTQCALGVGCLLSALIWLPETHSPSLDFRLRQAFRIYWDILKDRDFLGYTMSGSAAYAALFAYVTGSPFVFIEIYNVPKESYGWIFGANSFGLIALSQLNARFLKTYSLQKVYRNVLLTLAIFGSALIAVGLAGGSFWALAVPLFFYVGICGMVMPNALAGALKNQQARAGMASALAGTLQFVVATTASALVSYFHNGTLVPMTAIMGLGAFVAVAIYFRIPRGFPVG